MSSLARSAALGCALALFAAGCGEEVLLSLAFHEDPDGRPSGFACVDEEGELLLSDPWDMPVRPVVVVEVIRFLGDPPASARLSDIRDTCATGADGPIALRPCVVERRACIRLRDRVGTESVRRYVERQLAARTGDRLLLEGIDVAMFRVIVTTQAEPPCPLGDYARPPGEASPAPPPLSTEGGVVLGCAYSQPLTLDHDQTATVALDAPTPCGQRDVDQCVDLVPMSAP